MATRQEVSERLDTIDAGLGKVAQETTALKQEVEDLKNAAAGQVPDEIAERIDIIAARVQAVDDLVQDVTPSDPV